MIVFIIFDLCDAKVYVNNFSNFKSMCPAPGTANYN